MKPSEAIRQIEEEGINLKSMKAAVDALERMIPTQPYMESDGFADGSEVWEYYCPMCNYAFEENVFNYCPRCGQKIDWSPRDEEDANGEND